MKKVKLTVDGKEVPLTDDQLRMLGLPPTRNNPFERVKSWQEYYCLTDYCGAIACSESNKNLADKNYEIVNYFNDKNFAEQVYLRQLLYRKLLKFAYDNGLEDIEKWNGLNQHWYVFYNYSGECFDYYFNDEHKSQSVYFSSPEGASRAIKEVVEPFMKEHPEFVW